MKHDDELQFFELEPDEKDELMDLLLARMRLKILGRRTPGGQVIELVETEDQPAR